MIEEVPKVVDESSEKTGMFGLLGFYYVLTPLFLVPELIWGIKVRVPLIMESTELRYGYYGVCFVCGVLCFFRQKLTLVVAFAESTINIALLCLGFYLMIVDYYLEAAEGNIDNIPEALTHKGISGFVLALAIWVIAFKRSEWVLGRGKHNLK
jgi:hypothetical protein